MDIHPLGGKIETFRDYLKHLSMVVLGILIALGLDGLREVYHERSLERHSVHAMRAEIEYNQKLVRKAIDRYAKVHQSLDQVVADIERKQRKGPPKPGADEEMTLEFATPSLVSGAWQAALATQVFAHMDYSQTQLWSTTYALQNQVMLLQNESMRMFDRVALLSQMSEQSSPEELRAQMIATHDILQRVATSEFVWHVLIEQYDTTLAQSAHAGD
jgi:hypothetical protein